MVTTMAVWDLNIGGESDAGVSGRRVRWKWEGKGEWNKVMDGHCLVKCAGPRWPHLFPSEVPRGGRTSR